MEETISLEEIFGIIKKRMVMIAATTFIGIGLAAMMTFFVITPKYSSASQLLAKMSQGENNTVNVGDVNSNLMLINTYKDVIKSNLVMEESAIALSEKGFDITTEGLRGMIAVEQAANSQMFTVSATTADPKLAQAAANTVAQVFKDNAKEVIDVDKISIIADAPEVTKPVSPNNKLNLLIGAVLGMMFGLGLALVNSLFDKTIKDDSFITKELGIAILGAVPEMTSAELKNDITTSKLAAATEAPTGTPRRNRNRV